MFKIFGEAVATQLNRMKNFECFTVDTEGLYEHYLGSFPEGTNPLYRTRTEHDCTCCRNFIKNAGGIVIIDDNGQIVTPWDVKEDLPEHYRVVADSMAAAVKSRKIKSVFRSKENRYGNAETIERLTNGDVHRWHHFVCIVPGQFKHTSPDAARGEINTAREVFKRGLEELQLHAFDSVLEMIGENLIYRGAEQKPPLLKFRALLEEYRKLNSQEARELFTWKNYQKSPPGFRNTAIGTLITDISNGEDIEVAVRKFESKVAPENYKRTTALITPKMIESAMKTLEDLGLQDAVQRRHARLEDIDIKNVYFVDNSVRNKMKGGLSDLLMDSVKPKPFKVDDAQTISSADFFRDVLPKAVSVQLFVKNAHQTNFMNVVAPVYSDTGRLFKWANDFSWSYDGDAADSIKQKVKRAGGNVTNAKLRVSLAWHNTDDLDLHCDTPNGHHISFSNKMGILDVDMNVTRVVRDPVENMSFKASDLRDGKYVFIVNQFTRRETTDFGFTLEVEAGGQIQQFVHEKAMMAGRYSGKLVIEVKNGYVVDVVYDRTCLRPSNSSVEKWGVKTESFVDVHTIMNSPNFWDGQTIGNEHWFFILKDCKNPEPVRGIYNEFLRGELDQHRKVFEILGAKTKCPVADEQLSGVGFTSSRGDEATVLVDDGRSKRAYSITF